jgi:stage V sporulation protein B
LRKFFKTVAIVTTFSISEKFLGFLYRIFLSRTIGSEGMGVYQVALSVFALLFTACSAGTPITVSRLMTKYRAENRPDKVAKIITAGLSFTLAVAVPICLLFVFFTDWFSFLFTDPRCIDVFMVVLPGLIFTSVYAVLRGVFWGDKDFLPYSVIELLEEICMILVGVVLISQATDVYKGAFRAGVAVLISYVFSFTVATVVFFIRGHRLKSPKGQLKPLLASALPVTFMRTANSLSMSLVSVILPMRLVFAGFTNAQAMSMIGSAMGQAIPLLYIPTTLIGSFTLVLIPEISENFYKQRSFYLKRDIEKALKFTTFLTCLFIPVFLVCGEEIGILIFDNHECGKYLSASAILMLFMSLSNITTSMLNSMGLENKTLIFFVIGGGGMLLSVWLLPSVVGIYSLLIGFAFIYALTTVLNLVLIHKNCGQKPQYIKFVLKSVMLLVPTAIMGFMIEKLLLSALGLLLTLIVCAVIMIIFNALLYVGCGLVGFKFLSSKLKTLFSRKRTTKRAL